METMETLPMDITTDILSKLPAKPLLRFKSVCKSWYDLINGLDFAKRHLKRSLTTQSNLYYVYRKFVYHIADFDSFDNAVELHFPFKTRNYGGAKIIGSCNGLLCFWNYDYYNFIVFLFNPTTRTHKVIPFLPRPSCVAGLNYKFIHGFGYDSVSDGYKFVRILQCYRVEGVVSYSELMVYSLKSDSWTRVLDHVPIRFTCRRGGGVLVNEKLHWVNDIRLHDLPLPIVSFDLSTHSFGEVPGPVLVPLNDIHGVSYYMSIHVGVLDGCLCILINHLYVSEIMVMKEYGVVESWSKLLRVWKGESVNDIERTIAYTRSKKELLVKLVLHRFASINLEDMVIEGSLPIHNPSRQHDVHVCVENLLVLDCLSDLPESKQQGENTRRKRRRRRGRRRN